MKKWMRTQGNGHGSSISGSELAEAQSIACAGSANGLPNMKSFAAFALFAVSSHASEDAERARILSEIEALKGQLQQQRTIIQQQFLQLANLEEDEERRLQTVGNVTATAWATEKAALEATDGSMAAAMDTLWLCLCGALVYVHACRLRHVGDRMLSLQERIQRVDEELGQCVCRHSWVVGSWIRFCLWGRHQPVHWHDELPW